MSELEHIIDEATGANDHSMWRGRPYEGQSWTDSGERGKQEIKGVTFRDLRDCYIRAWCMSAAHLNETLYDEALKGEQACLCANDVYGLEGSIDPMAILQNLSCEIERLMGIFPNVPPLAGEEARASIFGEPPEESEP